MSGAAPESQVPKPRGAVRAVAWSIVNRGAIVLLNAATGILTARLLHPGGNGELSALKLWPLFLANLTALGTPTALVYQLRRQMERRGELIASALVLVTVLGALAAILGAFILPRWLAEYPPEIVFYARLFLITAPFWAVQITGQAALEALERFSLSNIVQIMIPATTLAGLLGCVAFGQLTPVSAGWCYAVAIVPTALTILTLLWRLRMPRASGISVDAWRLLLGYGVRSAPLDLLGTLNIYLDQVLVIGLLPAQVMGSYAVVLSLSRVLLTVQNAVVMVLFPKTAGRDTAAILAIVGQSVRVGTLVTGTAALGVALLGPWLIGLLYGPQYLAAVPALRLLVVEVVLQGTVVVLTQAFLAAGRPGVVSMLQGVGLAMAVPLMYVFIPRFGGTGAALALLCSTFARLVLIAVAMRVVLRQPLPRLWPGADDVAVLIRLVRRAP